VEIQEVTLPEFRGPIQELLRADRTPEGLGRGAEPTAPAIYN